VVSNYHGLDILDDCRWLKSQENDSVIDWVANQNKVSKKYLKRLVSKYQTDQYINWYMYSEFGDYDGKLKRNIVYEYFFNKLTSFCCKSSLCVIDLLEY